MDTTNVLIDFKQNKLTVDNDGVDFIAREDKGQWSVRCTRIWDYGGYLSVKGDRVFHLYIFDLHENWYTDDQVEKSRFVKEAFDEPEMRSHLEWTSKFPFIKKVTQQKRQLKTGWQRIKETRQVDVKLPKATYAIINKRGNKVDSNA